jgi:hypothetical protein
MEVGLRRVLREAGARVVPNAKLRDLGVRSAPRNDNRNIEAAAYGLPLFQGMPLLVDITMVSPLHADGTPRRGAAATDGVAAESARARKESTYPELRSSDTAKLVVVACETGGRWSEEAVDFLRQLAQARSRSAPAALRKSAELGWLSRWSGIMAVAAQASLATTLMGGDPWTVCGRDGFTPGLDKVLVDTEPDYSRLPLH